jgi:hypothetical protein
MHDPFVIHENEVVEQNERIDTLGLSVVSSCVLCEKGEFFGISPFLFYDLDTSSFADRRRQRYRGSPLCV